MSNYTKKNFDKLLEACKATERYDEAIKSCANDPKKMSTFCTSEGDDLDTLYLDWITKVKQAIAKAEKGE